MANTRSAQASSPNRFQYFPMEYKMSDATSITTQADTIVARIRQAVGSNQVVGLTYSANRGQTEAIHAYNNSNNKNAALPALQNEFVGAANQGAVMRQVIQRVAADESLRNHFRILPISTMARVDGDIQPTKLEWSQQEMEHIRDFAKQPNAVILGWRGYAEGTPAPTDERLSIGGGISSNVFTSEHRDPIVNYLNELKAALNSKQPIPDPKIGPPMPNVENTKSGNTPQGEAPAKTEAEKAEAAKRTAETEAHNAKRQQFANYLEARGFSFDKWTKISPTTDEQKELLKNEGLPELSSGKGPEHDLTTGVYRDTGLTDLGANGMNTSKSYGSGGLIYYDSSANSVRPVDRLPQTPAERSASIYAMVKFLRDAGNSTVLFDCKNPALVDPKDLELTLKHAKALGMTVEISPTVRSGFAAANLPFNAPLYKVPGKERAGLLVKFDQQVRDLEDLQANLIQKYSANTGSEKTLGAAPESEAPAPSAPVESSASPLPQAPGSAAMTPAQIAAKVAADAKPQAEVEAKAPSMKQK